MKQLTPDEIVERLENGTDNHDEILADLDVDQCHFDKSVNAGSTEPATDTGQLGHGAALNGRLVFTQKDFLDVWHKGETPIIVTDETQKSLIGLYLRCTYGVIIGTDIEAKKLSFGEAHFLPNIRGYPSALLDNPSSPCFVINWANKTLCLPDGSLLRSGDKVTVDPQAGKIWRGALPIIEPAGSATRLEKYILQNTSPFAKPSIAFHVNDRTDMYTINMLSCGLFRTNLPIGLWRTERSAIDFINKTGPASLMAIVRDSKLKWEDNRLNGLPTHSFYRLADIPALMKDLPRRIQDEITASCRKGSERSVADYCFEFHKHQAINAMTSFGELPKYTGKWENQTIVATGVTDSKTAMHYRNMIKTNGVIPYIHFGAMIESGQTPAMIAAIAKYCDCLCIGTNDDTAARTGLPRTQRDHSVWMRERGYKGASPFEVLVPEEIQPLAAGLAAARRANPKIFINFCGVQTGGHDIASIYAALDMGADQLTIPPIKENVLRTMLAIKCWQARKIVCGPNAAVAQRQIALPSSFSLS